MPSLTSSQSTSTPKMPGFTKDLYKDVYKDIRRSYNKGEANVFTNPTFAAFSDPQVAAMNGMMDLSNANSNGAGMSGALQNILTNGGFNKGQENAIGGLGALANNAKLQSLVSGNGLTDQQNSNFGALQGVVGKANSNFDALLRNGGMDTFQNAAYSQLADSASKNNATFGNLINNGGFSQGQRDAIGAMGQTVAGNNAALQDRFNNGGFDANQGAAYSGLTNTVNNNNAQFADTFARGGFDERQAAAYAGLNNTVNQNNASMAANTAYGGLTADQRAAMNRYQQQATTPLEFNQDYLRTRQSALDKQADALSQRAAAAGRYGGGMDQAILAREQGDLAARMNVEQMMNDQAQKNLANAAIMSGGQQAVGNQIGVNQAQQQGYNNLGTFGQIGQGNQLALNNAQQQGYRNVVDTGQVGFNNQLAANSAIRDGQKDLLNAEQMGITNQQNLASAQQAGAQNVLNSGQIGVNNQQSLANAQQQGLQGLNSILQQGVGNQNSTAGLLSNLQNSIFNANQAGLGNMGTAYQTAQQPYQTQMNVGNLQQAQNQNLINDQIRMFNESNPMNIYSQYLQLASGMPTGQVTTTQASPLQTLITAGLGGAGLYGALFNGGGAAGIGGGGFAI